MSTISTVISELLFERDSVTVPGLGMFIRHDDGAKVNVITNHFERPSSTVEFDPQQRGEDGVLVKALAIYEGCSEEETQQELTQFVADCFADLKVGKTVSLPGLGTLSMDDDAGLGFVQDKGVNLNGDAFGLGDFTPSPVYVGKGSEDWKTQVAQRNKDLQTPLTVDRKALDDDEGDESAYHRQRRRSIIWTVISLLLAIPAVLILLVFLDVIQIDLPFKSKPSQPPQPQQVHVAIDTSLLKYMVHYEPIPVANEDTLVQVADSIISADTVSFIADTITTENSVDPSTQTSSVSTTETSNTSSTQTSSVSSAQTPVVTSPTEPSINIIGGCFSQQENAEKLVASIHDLGYENAYVMKRGNMYYVSYGSYATLEEAKAGLSQIRSTTDNKAWILNK